MDKRHRFCAENLSAYMDNALGVRDKQLVERHLAECVRCQEDLVTLRQTRALLRRAPLRPLPRSFTLPASAQPEQARFRRWTATYSFLRLATTAVTLLLVLLLSGDVLLSMGVLPVPDQSPPAHELVLLQPAAPAEENVPPAVAPQPTQPAVAQAPLEQAVPEMARATEGQAPAEEQPAPSQPAAEPAMAPQALAAPQEREGDSEGAAQGEMADIGALAEPASPQAAMAPKRAAASPQEPALKREEPQETAAGLGAGPAQAEPSQAPMAAPSPPPRRNRPQRPRQQSRRRPWL